MHIIISIDSFTYLLSWSNQEDRLAACWLIKFSLIAENSRGILTESESSEASPSSSSVGCLVLILMCLIHTKHLFLSSHFSHPFTHFLLRITDTRPNQPFSAYKLTPRLTWDLPKTFQYYFHYGLSLQPTTTTTVHSFHLLVFFL